MSSHTINGTISAGYSLSAKYDVLYIGPLGAIYGYGLRLNHFATVYNDYKIKATDAGVGNNGISATAGANITNFHLISGYNGVSALNVAATVTNHGGIYGTARFGTGVFLEAGGMVTNGSRGDHNAYIRGQDGSVLSASTATVVNYGVVEGRYGAGVSLVGGLVTNASGGFIYTTQGGPGVEIQRGAGTVANSGYIGSYGAAAVVFDRASVPQPDIVTNSGYIRGTTDGVQFGNSGTVFNLAEIKGGQGAGIYAAGKCAVTNGSATDVTATVEGHVGIHLNIGSVANFGTIESTGAFGYGVIVETANVTNGSASDKAALIQGYSGLSVGAYGLNTTVANFGTIAATGARAAVTFHDASDVLMVEAGCVFKGAVLGAGGTLDLDNGTGALTGLLASGTVTVSGSMAATAFSNFGTVRIGPTATFATSGAVSLAAGQSVVAAGSLTLGSSGMAIANAGAIETLGGTVTVAGKVTGKGEAIVNGGLVDFTSTFSQSVTFAGSTGTLELARSQSYGGTIAGFSKSGGTFLDLTDIAFTGSGEATYSGTKKGGVLTVTDGTHTAHINLKGNYLNSTFVAAGDGHGGTIIHDPSRGAAAPPAHQFIAAMAGLGGGGAGLEIAAAWRLHTPPMLLAPRTQIA